LLLNYAVASVLAYTIRNAVIYRLCEPSFCRKKNNNTWTWQKKFREVVPVTLSVNQVKSSFCLFCQKRPWTKTAELGDWWKKVDRDVHWRFPHRNVPFGSLGQQLPARSHTRANDPGALCGDEQETSTCVMLLPFCLTCR